MRRSFVSVTWMPGVDAAEAELLIRVIDDVYDLLRPHFGVPGQFDPLPEVQVFGAWELKDMPEGSAYRDVAWFMTRSLDESRRYHLASRYVRLVELEPWQASQPHLDLALTNFPILDDRHNISTGQQVLGISRRGLVSLISTRRLGQIASPVQRELAMRHLYQHFLGEMFDIPDPRRVDSLMLVDGEPYCTNRCAMRYTPAPKEALAYGQEQASDAIIYCDACQQDLVARLVGYHYGMN